MYKWLKAVAIAIKEQLTRYFKGPAAELSPASSSSDLELSWMQSPINSSVNSSINLSFTLEMEVAPPARLSIASLIANPLLGGSRIAMALLLLEVFNPWAVASAFAAGAVLRLLETVVPCMKGNSGSAPITDAALQALETLSSSNAILQELLTLPGGVNYAIAGMLAIIRANEEYRKHFAVEEVAGPAGKFIAVSELVGGAVDGAAVARLLDIAIADLKNEPTQQLGFAVGIGVGVGALPKLLRLILPKQQAIKIYERAQELVEEMGLGVGYGIAAFGLALAEWGRSADLNPAQNTIMALVTAALGILQPVEEVRKVVAGEASTQVRRYGFFDCCRCKPPLAIKAKDEPVPAFANAYHNLLPNL